MGALLNTASTRLVSDPGETAPAVLKPRSGGQERLKSGWAEMGAGVHVVVA